MDLKEEFILQAVKEDSNISELCRIFGISRKTGYKLLNRYKDRGMEGLEEHSRCHLSHPLSTPEEIQKLILAERKLHPCWGARKLKKVLENNGIQNVPSKSSINRVLEKNGLLKSQQELRTTPWNFFEHPNPNDLWQMDFKGHFSIAEGRCHPLTILDDHSRFSVTLKAYENEQGETVKPGLIEAFRRYGLPGRINVDNGAPWGTMGQGGYTALAIWLIRLGIRVSHSRPYHPQTNGKDERFHRTLKAEVLQGRHFRSLEEAQEIFDEWRHIYNTKRPHQALNMDTPITRYTPSTIAFPEKLPEIEYGDNDIVRIVDATGGISVKKIKYYISEGLVKEPVALRPTLVDGRYEVFYCAQKIRTIDLTINI